ncbi:hypothetical protein QPL77_14690 [Bacillus pumilus]|uniref:hypothetical protein n=1 Tax=Bacillus pumilus TaxID=1408 RepID=UPI00253FCBB5|nr:hypothetical protein [Bacillus pumilus]WIG31222.1 hypothetical protein QPL77_14690 [Bacillus pumilus]
MAALKGVKTLDMVGGEITKVSYEGSEYERVEGDAKVGDLVLCTDVTWCDATEGAFYLSIAKGPVIVDDVDDKYRYYSDVYTLFRKKPTRLKVGDYAKVVDAADHRGLAEGDFVRISEDDESDIPFYCDVLSGELAKNSVWMREKKLVPATEAEVAAAKEAEAKRAIEAKWAKIGRKVGEYKKGDIVAYDDPAWFGYKGIGTVIKDTDQGCDPLVEAVTSAGVLMPYCLRESKLTLITPVEARFDRS